jgi:hypothetical protein
VSARHLQTPRRGPGRAALAASEQRRRCQLGGWCEWLSECWPGPPFTGLVITEVVPEHPLNWWASDDDERRICRHSEAIRLTGCQRRPTVAEIDGYGVCDCVGRITPADRAVPDE